MRFPITLLYITTLVAITTAAINRTVSPSLFYDLEEYSRLVSISYCIGSTGIQEPFTCLSHCSEFTHFQLVSTWSTGLIETNSAGYIALSHAPNRKRIIAVFRGTHSFADVVRDLTTNPSAYLPYPAQGADGGKCENCTVHEGFMETWNETKPIVIPVLKQLIKEYPEYEVVLAGHSLGGAVAALAALNLKARGIDVRTTTFGQPRLGNLALAQYMDRVFPWNVTESEARFRRVTHIGDPVPLLPFEDWGWRMQGGEIFISKAGLPPEIEDLERCEGPNDERCIQGPSHKALAHQRLVIQGQYGKRSIPRSWQLWQLLFAHREYFWRIGLCFDPQWRNYKPGDL